jgi:hypothetical protein
MKIILLLHCRAAGEAADCQGPTERIMQVRMRFQEHDETLPLRIFADCVKSSGWNREHKRDSNFQDYRPFHSDHL